MVENDVKPQSIDQSFYTVLQDYDAALSVYEILLEKDAEHKTALLSGMGRVHLQVRKIVTTLDMGDRLGDEVVDLPLVQMVKGSILAGSYQRLKKW